MELLLAELFEHEPLTNRPLSSSLSNSTSDVGESIPYFQTRRAIRGHATKSLFGVREGSTPGRRGLDVWKVVIFEKRGTTKYDEQAAFCSLTIRYAADISTCTLSRFSDWSRSVGSGFTDKLNTTDVLSSDVWTELLHVRKVVGLFY